MNGIFPKAAKKGWRLGLLLALGTVLAGNVAVAEDYREHFDDGWHFKYFGAGNPAEQAEEVRYAPAQTDYDESAAPAVPAPAGADTARTPLWSAGFRAVQLPHDWAIESPTLPAEPNETGKLPWNGFGWYRKSFIVPADFSRETQRWYLDFDGVMSHPKVFVNGHLAGEWAYGYSSFRVDISPYLEAGKPNLVAVEVSNLPHAAPLDCYVQRWTRRGGFVLHLSAAGADGKMKELAKLTNAAVGSYGTQLKAMLPAGTKTLLLTADTDAEGGVLLDDFCLMSGKMELRSVAAVNPGPYPLMKRPL